MSVCPLCQNSQTKLFYEEKRRPFFLCPVCFLIFVPEAFHISADEEKKRYDFHENDPKGQNYLAYKSWMRDFFNWVGREQLQGQVCDYGSGPHPILEEILKEEGSEHLTFSSYDVYYAAEKFPAPSSVDVILLSEVVEHFRDLRLEWEKISQSLKPHARIYIRTSLWSDKTTWSSWAYARDNTHIAFYHEKTFLYLAKLLGASLVRLEGDKVEMLKGSYEN